MNRKRSPNGQAGQRLVTVIPFVWLSVFFLAPFLIVFAISLSQSRYGVPPYEPLVQGGEILARLDNYTFLLGDALYVKALINSLRIAATSAFACLLIGYPVALAIARSPQRWRALLLLTVILPFWTSFLIRVYAWIGLLKSDGLINHMLQATGLTDAPIQLLQTSFAVHLGIVYSYLALHDPAAVRRARTPGFQPARGGIGPRCRALARFRDDYPALVDTGRDRGVPARVNSCRRRVRNPRTPRQFANRHDR